MILINYKIMIEYLCLIWDRIVWVQCHLEALTTRRLWAILSQVQSTIRDCFIRKPKLYMILCPKFPWLITAFYLQLGADIYLLCVSWCPSVCYRGLKNLPLSDHHEIGKVDISWKKYACILTYQPWICKPPRHT